VVIPRWVLALDGAAQRAIVLHEQEHRRTRDPALLVAGLAALVLMPWNVGMWLAWRGLRLAVEFDCDERVLRRGIDRAGYAQILLGAWGQTRTSWLPSAALTRASGLGSRVQHLMRPEPRRRGMKALIGTMAAALLVFAACETPAPQSIAGPEPTTVKVREVPGQSMAPLVIVDGVVQDQDSQDTRVIRDVALTARAAQGSANQSEAPVMVRGQLMKVVADSDQAARERKQALESAVTYHARTSGPVKIVGDGVPGVLSRIPADSIASIEVLKGNKATAQYGPGALHGVIIITTKAAARDTVKM
jgi:TonB-dependent SusC/RagA subfamily outer membrane receptor